MDGIIASKDSCFHLGSMITLTSSSFLAILNYGHCVLISFTIHFSEYFLWLVDWVSWSFIVVNISSSPCRLSYSSLLKFIYQPSFSHAVLRRFPGVPSFRNCSLHGSFKNIIIFRNLNSFCKTTPYRECSNCSRSKRHQGYPSCLYI